MINDQSLSVIDDKSLCFKIFFIDFIALPRLWVPVGCFLVEFLISRRQGDDCDDILWVMMLMTMIRFYHDYEIR